MTGRFRSFCESNRFGHEPIKAVVEATEESAILRNDVYDRDPVDSWGAGRVTLLGDAAHPMTPNLGQGACPAIEDAVTLARCVERYGCASSTLRCYEARRMARTAAITRLSRRLGQMWQWESPLANFLTHLVARMMPAS